MRLGAIGDLSESLVNASTSRAEAVTPHGVNIVCRALVFRLRHTTSCGPLLPFGSAAGVSAFRRLSHAVWFAPVTLLRLHTTVFFGDFFTVCEKMSANHVNLCLDSFFSLLGRGLVTEEDAMFLS